MPDSESQWQAHQTHALARLRQITFRNIPAEATPQLRDKLIASLQHASNRGVQRHPLPSGERPSISRQFSRRCASVCCHSRSDIGCASEAPETSRASWQTLPKMDSPD